MHRIDQTQSIGNPAVMNQLGDLTGNIDKTPPGFDVKNQFFAQGFHKTPQYLCQV